RGPGTNRVGSASRNAPLNGTHRSTVEHLGAILPRTRGHRRHDAGRRAGARVLPPPFGRERLNVMRQILVVEDDMQIARTLRDYLEAAGFGVTVVGDGSAAVSSFRGHRPDLMVLDLGLPGVAGLAVAREVRRGSPTPIIMLTARGEESDRIVGLELGAD